MCQTLLGSPTKSSKEVTSLWSGTGELGHLDKIWQDKGHLSLWIIAYHIASSTWMKFAHGPSYDMYYSLSIVKECTVMHSIRIWGARIQGGLHIFSYTKNIILSEFEGPWNKIAKFLSCCLDVRFAIPTCGSCLLWSDPLWSIGFRRKTIFQAPIFSAHAWAASNLDRIGNLKHIGRPADPFRCQKQTPPGIRTSELQTWSPTPWPLCYRTLAFR